VSINQSPTLVEQAIERPLAGRPAAELHTDGWDECTLCCGPQREKGYTHTQTYTQKWVHYND